MVGTTLGLDVGTASIGWTLVDENRAQIVATGVRIFPEGVDRDQQGGEKSKTQTRRDARGSRRQLLRRRLRKRRLLDLLTESDLLPADRGEMEELLAQNPYSLRARALDEKLDPYQIGRVLTHLNQRRGFLSNRKTDRAKAKETKGMLAEISDLAKAIDEAQCRTLGEYLAALDGRFTHNASSDTQRVRHRHTRRDMFGVEFAAIWAAQQQHHASLCTDALGEQIRRVIFFQRKMRWPKSVVGQCELEPRKKRCPTADRAAQRFRLLQEVNNLRILDTSTGEERRLTPDERSTLLAYLSYAKERKFDDIRKKLGLDEHNRFNFERAERNKLKGHVTDAILGGRGVLGKRWRGFPDDTRNAIVELLRCEKPEDEALACLTTDHGLTRDEAERAMGANLPDGYMSFSREAIDKLLPHLERGLNLMGDDASNSALHAAGYLRPDQRVVHPRQFLPSIPELTNPIVRQALIEVRKLVNAIIREHGCPAAIHVELARDAKRSFRQRREVLFENSKRRARREEAAQRIEEQGDKPTRSKINRYLLWEEQNRECIYSGHPISLTQLLSDAVDVDHILPRWRSLDDSLANKVVCLRAENVAKGDRTPREWLEDGDADKYEQLRQRLRKLPYGKQRKMLQKDIVLDDFVHRQLTDTAYISRCVTQYLKCLGSRIVMPRGQMTADLRHYWGLNTILDVEGRGEKNRADHRHHAIDALIIALTDSRRLHALANARGKSLPLPWERFRDDVDRAIGAINVSHRVRRRISGALHEETFYGATQKGTDTTADNAAHRPWATNWVEEVTTYVRRKPVTDVKNGKHLEKIRDGAIREILRAHLRKAGVDPDQKGNYPSAAFKGDQTPRMPSGIPIKKVRMLEESKTFQPVSERRSHQHVKPGNNHHIVYRAVSRDGKERWTGEVVTMWEAALRARNARPVVDQGDNDKGRFVMSLSINELIEIEDDLGHAVLCVVRKMDQRSKRVEYKLHTDARKSGEINQDNLYLSPDRMRQLEARKVTVDLLGRIRRAND